MKRRSILALVVFFAFGIFTGAKADITVPWEHITGYNSSPPYGWSYSYDIGYYNSNLLIDVDIMFSGYTPSELLQDRWEIGIESIWSTDRFSVPILFNVDWVTENYDYLVGIINGNGDYSDWDMLTWCTEGAAGWGDAYQEEVVAHEFGHMVSMWDEYAGGAVNPSTLLINTGGLMHTLSGPTLDHYYDPFLDWYEVKVAPLHVPAPGALILVSIGIGFINCLRRRKNI